MENKEFKVIPPEGYEIDKENSTFECIKFKSKSLTYEDIARELFKENIYYTDNCGNIRKCNNPSIFHFTLKNNATSEKQLEKLLAINKLMNVAKYLNGGWKPDQDSQCENKYYIYINVDYNDIKIGIANSVNAYTVYFKTVDLAHQAIDILGEKTIRLAFSTDY